MALFFGSDPFSCVTIRIPYTSAQKRKAHSPGTLVAGSCPLPKSYAEADPGPRRPCRRHTEYPRILLRARCR